MSRQWVPTEDQVLDEQEALRYKQALPIEPEPTEWHEVFNSPFKVKCDCPMPQVYRSGSQALGYVVDIDLCCLAKAVERLSGETFYRLTQTAPVFVWDEDTLDERKRRRGPPVPWMLKRLKELGLPWRKNGREHYE